MKNKFLLLNAMLTLSMVIAAQSWLTGTQTIYTSPDSTKVGIGTATPQYKLDVKGTIRAREIIVNTTGKTNSRIGKSTN